MPTKLVTRAPSCSRSTSPATTASSSPGARARFPSRSISPASTTSSSRAPLTGHRAVVVHAHQLDHLPHVVVGLHAARRNGRLTRERRVILDATFGAQLTAECGRQPEVCGVIAVEVAD